MSSQKTTNYDLNQWLPDDAVLRTDFNADNAKIDAAIHALEGRNCRLYTQTYTGTGSGGRTFTFPYKPIVVMVMGEAATWMCAIQGVPFTYLRYSGSSCSMLTATWSGNTLTWGAAQDSPTLSANVKGATYVVAALLDVEQ